MNVHGESLLTFAQLQVDGQSVSDADVPAAIVGSDMPNTAVELLVRILCVCVCKYVSVCIFLSSPLHPRPPSLCAVERFLRFACRHTSCAMLDTRIAHAAEPRITAD